MSPPRAKGPASRAPHSRWRQRYCGNRKGAWEPVRPRACAILDRCPSELLALPFSRENSVLTLEPAAALTFRHGAEGGDGRWWRCEDSAQASPPLSSLGGEWGTGHRTAATLAEVLAPHWSRDGDRRSSSRLEFDWLRAAGGAGKNAVRRGSLATSAVSDGIGQSWPWSGSTRGLYLLAGAVDGPQRLGVTSLVSLWEPS